MALRVMRCRSAPRYLPAIPSSSANAGSRRFHLRRYSGLTLRAPRNDEWIELAREVASSGDFRQPIQKRQHRVDERLRLVDIDRMAGGGNHDLCRPGNF